MARPSRRSAAMLPARDGEMSGTMKIATLGIDLGKTLNSVVGMDATGRVVLGRRVRRATLKAIAVDLAPCVVAMEACCGAHHGGAAACLHRDDAGCEIDGGMLRRPPCGAALRRPWPHGQTDVA